VKFAIITGASFGIGAAAAQRFMERDYQVLNLARNSCPVDGVEDFCGDLTVTARDPAFMRRLRERVAGAGRLCLVHNACLYRKDTALDTDDAGLAAALDLNLRVPNLLNTALVASMPPGSSILYVGSTLSEMAVSGSFSYVVSKHALIGMMRACTQDLAGRSIHAACICPGFTDTKMLREHFGNDLELLQTVAGTNAFGRLLAPAEIADLLVLAAASPALNGAVLHANLGQINH